MLEKFRTWWMLRRALARFVNDQMAALDPADRRR
jgi:hypothetical protein